MKTITKSYLKELTYEIIGAAIEVHKQLGPGLLEKVYEVCMVYELSLRGISVKSQQTIPVFYKGVILDAQLRYDLLVEDCIVVELKAVMEMMPLFEAQALSYARLLEVPKAIVLNFNCTNIFKEGQKTFVNDLFRQLPE
ncbi:MAG: GxxExxY protein [Saprospiraceae bacterium]|jgi:GxxExxY protein|nr:GxxExxY protein [Saprospiraceae bacterium]